LLPRGINSELYPSYLTVIYASMPFKDIYFPAPYRQIENTLIMPRVYVRVQLRLCVVCARVRVRIMRACVRYACVRVLYIMCVRACIVRACIANVCVYCV
jgi:hypothetical protein